MHDYIFYLVIIIVTLYVTKPAIFFKPNGKPRIYGVGLDEEGYRKTFYTFQFAVIVIVFVMVSLTN
jgi:hypothetical protein